MPLSSWMSFLAVAAATAFTPGPAVALALTNAMTVGARRALAGSLGNASGVLLVGMACLTAVGWMVRQSPVAFGLIKLLGAGYLLWCGVSLWRNKPGAIKSDRWTSQPAPTPARLYVQGMLVAVTNPKSFVFFSAMLPQFVDANRPDAGLAIILVGSFAAMTFISHAAWLCGASAIAQLRDRRLMQSITTRIAGGVLVTVAIYILVA